MKGWLTRYQYRLQRAAVFPDSLFRSGSGTRREPSVWSCYNFSMPDDIELRMNFIIEQQAQFASDIQLLKERETKIFQMIEANTRMIEANAARIRQLVDFVDGLRRRNGANGQQ